MESQRSLLVIGLLFVSFLLYQSWQADYGPTSQSATATQTVAVDSNLSSTATEDIPQSAEQGVDAAELTSSGATLVTLQTDVLKLQIDTQGGDVVRAELLAYPESLGSDTPFTLLERKPGFTYVAQSGLIGRDGPDSRNEGRPVYQTGQSDYRLAEGQDQLEVPLVWQGADGLKVTKTFILKRGSYAATVNYQVDNPRPEPAAMQLYGQLKETISEGKGNLVMPVYRGGAYSSEEVRYEKYSFDDMQDSNLNNSTEGGWVAMLQHYFVSAWIPADDQQNQLYSRILSNNDATIGFKAPAFSVPANGSAQVSANLWVGPKLQDQMAEAAKNLELTVDYGILWFIAQPLFWLLKVCHAIVGNWGFAIIMITLIVKGGMYPLTKAQYTSMAKMRMLQPKLTALRERFGEDRQKMSQAMMELYKQEKVNPLGGCFPIVLQMPIFIALYWTLMESVELRHAPFMLWIQDLSVQDPYYVLPLLMGVTMFLIQRMSPTTVSDPMQQKIMQLMPVMFTFFFLWFPAGLVLYWVISNVVTLTQQTLIYRNLEKRGLHSRK